MADVTDPVGFITARLADDEAGARAELPRARAEGYEGWLGRVLRDVAAKRRIMERAAHPVTRVPAGDDAFPSAVWFTNGRVYADAHLNVDITEQWNEWADAHQEPADPQTLRDLARSWSDHPDWKAEW